MEGGIVTDETDTQTSGRINRLTVDRGTRKRNRPMIGLGGGHTVRPTHKIRATNIQTNQQASMPPSLRRKKSTKMPNAKWSFVSTADLFSQRNASTLF